MRRTGASGPKPEIPSCTMVPLVIATSWTCEPHALACVEMSTPWSSLQVPAGRISDTGRSGNTQPPRETPPPNTPSAWASFSSRRTSASDGAPGLTPVVVRWSAPPILPLTDCGPPCAAARPPRADVGVAGANVLDRSIVCRARRCPPPVSARAAPATITARARAATIPISGTRRSPRGRALPSSAVTLPGHCTPLQAEIRQQGTMIY